VTLPGVVGELVGVHGRGPRDIWFLTNELIPLPHYRSKLGVAVHYDGKRVVKKHVPSCWSGHFSTIVTDRDRVLLQGMDPYVRGVAQMTASLSRDGKWGCEHAYSTLHVSPGEPAWTLACSSIDRADCFLTRADGRAAPLPTVHASFGSGGQATTLSAGSLWMRGLDDGWMTSPAGDGSEWLLRYNGVTWAPQAALGEGAEVLDMWVDEEGHVWLLVKGGKEDPGTKALRFDGRALHALPVPAHFAASRVTGTGPRDVWFVGAGLEVYQWDGERLRQGEAPFKVGDAWSAPGGELWIVGNSSGEIIAEEASSSIQAVAAHTAFRSEAR
jgi:hypothetical protein